MENEAISWRLPYIQLISNEFNDLAQACSPKLFETLCSTAARPALGLFSQSSCDTLDQIISIAHEQMSFQSSAALRTWFRMYTDASILRSLADISQYTAKHSVATLDRAIITCGDAGGRVDLILSIIETIQHRYLSFHPPTYAPARALSASIVFQEKALHNICSNIPTLTDIPSVLTFQSRLMATPFILRGYAQNWPAMQEHPWNSASYLRSVSGPGRIVPVEVGKDYRSHKWTQTLMSWDDFLSCLDLMDQPALKPSLKDLYMAQHNLLIQFPALRADVIIPDYVYTSVAQEQFPGYHPPGNEERLALNAWLGPGGTISPAHTDPYFNLFVQVVGRKSVWLAPPHLTPCMYPHTPSEETDTETRSKSMSNTSRVDVFVPVASFEFPNFINMVVPRAIGGTLNPGDLLFIPPGWWHGMRSEETSFSVSIWF